MGSALILHEREISIMAVEIRRSMSAGLIEGLSLNFSTNIRLHNPLGRNYGVRFAVAASNIGTYANSLLQQDRLRPHQIPFNPYK